jgi:hypothetical protein
MILALYAGPFQLQDRLFGTGSSGRVELWALGMERCPEFCTIGSGWGTFSDVYAATYGPTTLVCVVPNSRQPPPLVWESPFEHR